MSIWVDEDAISAMETLEEQHILTRVGEWNEDLNYRHAKCEMPVKTYNQSHQVSSLCVLLKSSTGDKSGWYWYIDGIYGQGSE